MAEREGFEPPNRFPRLRISSAVPSTTRPSLRDAHSSKPPARIQHPGGGDGCKGLDAGAGGGGSRPDGPRGRPVVDRCGGGPLRGSGAEVCAPGIPEQTGSRHERGGGGEASEGAPPGFLRMFRLAFLGAWPLDAGAAVAYPSRHGEGGRDPRGAGREPDTGPHRRRGGLFQSARAPKFRAHLRLGLAAQAGGGVEDLGFPRGPALVWGAAAAGRPGVRGLPGLPAEADLSDPHWRAPQLGLRP